MIYLKLFEEYEHNSNTSPNGWWRDNSNRFTHLKEVLDTIDDMCLDIKDEGFDTSFGIIVTARGIPFPLPTTLSNLSYANFDEYLDDIQIKLTSLGKRVMYIKFDVIKNLDKFKDEKSLIIFIDNIVRVYNYLISEGLKVEGLWSKELVVTNRSDYGVAKFFQHDNIEALINHIDWVKKEKLNNIVGRIDKINIKRDIYSFRQLEDVRIAFTGEQIENNLFEKREEDESDEIEENINDILLTIKDLGYDVKVDKKISKINTTNTYDVSIDSDKIKIDDEFIKCLKELVLYMKIYEYNYSASYYSGPLPEKFYIYTDERGLRTRGFKMDENWSRIRKIKIFFHKYKYA
jgi:uncharacterized protein (UPF0335 family)